MANHPINPRDGTNFCRFVLKLFLNYSTYGDGDIVIDQDEGGVDASELSFGGHDKTVCLINYWCKLPKINVFK